MTATIDRTVPPTAGAGNEHTLPAKLLARAATTPDTVALRHKQMGRWQEYTWADYADRAAAVGAGLASLGVGAGDTVAIHSENRPEWVFADLGTQGLGAVAVGVYPTSPAAEVEYLLAHSESKVVIAEDEEQLDKTFAVWDQLPDLDYAVVIDPRGVRVLDDPRVLTFDELLSRGRHAGSDAFDHSVASLSLDHVAVIVYTSGTTGPPKGAMISHRNLHTSSESYREVFGTSEGDEVLSYLPLCHIAERLVTVVNGVSHGYVANFGEGGETFTNDMREVQPTFFLGVPRVWEKMLAGIQVRMADASWMKRRNYEFWIARGRRLARSRMRGGLGFGARIVYALGWLMLYRALKERLGLARCDKALSGAAPIAPQVLEFFWSIGVPVREGYGQTENTGQATVNPDGDVRIGTVGVATAGAEVRIADDGEILTRGGGTFVGYLKNPEATAETITDDGWLHTGDIGELGDDGFLTITDRKKDIIITAGGKNISPSEIENRLKVSPYVREAVVIGDRRKYLTALIGIESDTVGDWATREGIPYTTYEDLSAKPEVRELIQRVVDETNVEFAQVETVKRFALIPVELDHEDGQLTATQKVKRSAIADQFAAVIGEMYA
ncbi:MAG: AMP-binding protein [Acidimicrobiales bacterium]|nr:AMP-binding protein [Acidimicrobiales bacterium]